MPRWETTTDIRLRHAALALFVKRGYESTTVDDIATVAGVTERTFFRHFKDKEEVLFDAEDTLRSVLVDAVRRRPPVTAPRATGQRTSGALDAARHAFRELARVLQQDHQAHRLRADVLAQSPSLRARQLLIQQRWADAVVEELIQHDIDARTARVAVTVAVSAVQLAYDEWVTTRTRKLLTTFMDEATDLFRATYAADVLGRSGIGGDGPPTGTVAAGVEGLTGRP